MDYEYFIDLVRKMRTAQNDYFKNRTRSSLIEAKQLEKEVDQALKSFESAPAQPDEQIDMFEEEAG